VAERRLVYIGDFGVEDIDPSADTITALGLTLGATGIDLQGVGKITNLLDGTNPQDAVTKAQLDQAEITGGRNKQLLLHPSQLSTTEGILAAMAGYFANNPSSGDQVIVSDGSTTRTYGMGTGGDVTVTIGGTAAITMQNLVTAINGDGSAAWTAEFEADLLDDINSGGVFVIIDDDTPASAASPLRMYANTWSTPADFQVIEYASGATPDVDADYRNSTSANAAAADPAAGRVGLQIQFADLFDGQFHNTKAGNIIYSWDADGVAWQIMTGPTSVPDATSASGGGVKGKVTFDSDKGLAIVGGVGEVSLEAAGAIEFGGAGGLQINLEASNPSLDIVSNELGVKYAALTSGLTQDGTGLKVSIDNNTLQLNGSGQLYAAGVDESEKVQNAYDVVTGSTGVAVGDPVFFADDDEIDFANASTASGTNFGSGRKVFGVASETKAAGEACLVVSNGDQIAGVLTSLSPTAGDPIFLASGGGLTGTAPTGNIDRVLVGYAINADDLFVKVTYLGRRRA